MRSKRDILVSQRFVDVKSALSFDEALATGIYSAMDEYAKEVAIAFADFKKNYRWLKSSNAWTSEKEDLLTTEQLFNLFIEQHNIQSQIKQ